MGERVLRFILEEIKEVSKKVFNIPYKISEKFLSEADLEIITREKYKDKLKESKTLINDQKDIPILAAALASKPDYLVTGDKDFHTEKIKNKLNIVKTTELLRIVMN